MSWAFSHPWGSIECRFSYPEDRCDYMTTPLIIADARTGEPSQRFHLDLNLTLLSIANRPGLRRPDNLSSTKTQSTGDRHHPAISIQKGQILIASHGALWKVHAKPSEKQSHLGCDGN
jgi:hypothetical protein